MQKNVLLTVLFSISVFTIFSCTISRHSKTKRLPGTWQAQPITIDGNDKDWQLPYPYYDDKAMLGYAVSNDKENLYITVETGDPATQLKILREGLTVWIDRKGEKEEVTAINYPIPTTIREAEHKERQRASQSGDGQQGLGKDRQQKQRMELEDKVRAALGNANEYSLQGFKGCNLQFPIMEMDTCGIVVRVGLDSTNELIWEAKIPFRSFYFKPAITRADKGMTISICFETTAMKRPAGQSGGGGRGQGGGFRPSVGFGGMGMGMGMGGGGGMRRGGGRSGPQSAPDIMEPAYKSTKTYKKTGIDWQE